MSIHRRPPHRNVIPYPMTRITATEWQSYLEACERKREQLIIQEKARLRANVLLDSDYDRIASQMAAWRVRYVARMVQS